MQIKNPATALGKISSETFTNMAQQIVHKSNVLFDTK